MMIVLHGVSTWTAGEAMRLEFEATGREKKLKGNVHMAVRLFFDKGGDAVAVSHLSKKIIPGMLHYLNSVHTK